MAQPRQAVASDVATLKIVDAAAEHYDTTGLHIRIDELKSWVDAVKLDTSAVLPFCHE